MLEKIRTLRRPGLRNIKTAIAAIICLALYRLIGRDSVSFALIATILCMQDSMGKSLRQGIDRCKGTVIGGLFGSLFAYFGIAELPLPLFLALAFLGTVAFIYICNMINARASIVIGCAVFLITAAGASGTAQPLQYVIGTTLDTLTGTLVALFVNQFIFRPRPDRYRGQEAVNPAFHYKIITAGHHKNAKWRFGDVTELYIYPEDAIDEDLDFDFRITVTTSVFDQSVFKKFPGYRRQIMLLDGELSLCHTGYHDIQLEQFETDFFRGDWETKSAGRAVEMNLFTGDGYSGSLEAVCQGHVFHTKNDHYTAFYILKDRTAVVFSNGGGEYRENLNRGDFVIVSWFENGRQTYTVSFPETVDTDQRETAAVKIECERAQAVDKAPNI